MARVITTASTVKMDTDVLMSLSRSTDDLLARRTMDNYSPDILDYYFDVVEQGLYDVMVEAGTGHAVRYKVSILKEEASLFGIKGDHTAMYVIVFISKSSKRASLLLKNKTMSQQTGELDF
jgi:hypothetical protein